MQKARFQVRTKQSSSFFLVALFSTLLVAASSGFAQTTNVYSDPVGYVTLTAVGVSNSTATSFLGLSLTQVVTNRGIIAAVAGSQLTLNQTLTSGQFNEVSNTPVCFIEITSGLNAGLFVDIVSNDTTSVYTATDISSLVSTGETYKIYPHWTIAKVFGPQDESGLVPGTSGDQILVPNPATGQFSTYYYSTGGKAGIGWRLSGGGAADQSGQVLYIDRGVIVKKVAGTSTNIVLTGAVKLGQTIEPIVGPGNNFVGNVYATSSMTLSNSGLYTGNPSTGLVGGTSGDLVLIHNDQTGLFNTYYWSTGGKAGIGWRLSGGGATDEGNTPIPLGANIVIQLAPGHTGFNWTAPAQY